MGNNVFDHEKINNRIADLTIRQEFARTVMLGMITKYGEMYTGKYVAQKACEYADALIAELNKPST